MKKMLSVLLVLTMLLVPFAYAEDAAANYPEREIHIIVPYDAGGASDMTSRIIATGIEDALGATVLVENRSGGSGSVGMTYARNSAPDGYTVCYIPLRSSCRRSSAFPTSFPRTSLSSAA